MDGSDGSSVSYTPDAFAPTRVDYNAPSPTPGPDSAYYTYGNTTYLMDTVCCPGGNCSNCTIPATASKLLTAQDTHADSPMRSIKYEYANPGSFQGQIRTEHHFASNAPVSTFTSTSCPTHPWSQSPDCPTATQTEARGDGPSRTIYLEQATAHVPLVKHKSDFNGVNEVFTYDSNNYLLTAQDRNGNTTTYTNEPVIGNPTRILHPDQTHIDYTYSDPNNPYHIQTLSDERANTTTYTRDGNNRVIEIDYPDGGNETFAYNNFGQVSKHRRKNGAYEYAAYDGTGLLSKLWNATSTDYGNSLPPDSAPHITLTYYSASPTPHPWQDRVQTVTYPTTGIGATPIESYEYDRALGTDGLTNLSGAMTHGRGLVTKITHADGNYQTFKYDAYGNKKWQDNETAQPDQLRLR